jgi:hypothetical protein
VGIDQVGKKCLLRGKRQWRIVLEKATISDRAMDVECPVSTMLRPHVLGPIPALGERGRKISTVSRDADIRP